MPVRTARSHRVLLPDFPGDIRASSIKDRRGGAGISQAEDFLRRLGDDSFARSNPIQRVSPSVRISAYDAIATVNKKYSSTGETADRVFGIKNLEA